MSGVSTTPAMRRLSSTTLPTEVVRKRPTCVIAPFQRTREGLGEPLPRYARLRTLIDFVEVVSKVARPMSLQAVLRGLGCSETGLYALIACISGTMPKICITRLRL